MTEELRIKRVPITDGQSVRYANTYVLSEYDLVNSETSDVNAFVPADAPIQPPQAFVDNIEKFSDFSTPIIDLSNQGITSIDAAFLTSWATRMLALVNPPNINLSGNALTSGTVIDLLAALVASTATGGTFNISGGTNGVPSPLPVFVLDLNNIDPVDTTSYGTTANGVVIYFELDGFPLSSSTVNWLGMGKVLDDVFAVFTVCVTDSPTKQQIIDELVSKGGGRVVDLGGLILQASPPDFVLEPLDFTGATGSSQTSGNTLIGQLRAKDWTVTTN